MTVHPGTNNYKLAQKNLVSEISDQQGSVELHAFIVPPTRFLISTVFDNNHLNCVKVVLEVANDFPDGIYGPNVSRSEKQPVREKIPSQRTILSKCYS